MYYAWLILYALLAYLISGVAHPYPHYVLPESHTVSSSPCSELLTWRIGEIDPRFEIERETLKKLMADVNDLWSAAAGKQVLAYSDSGKMEVNLIFGKHQESTESEQELWGRIGRLKRNHDLLKEQYTGLVDRHNIRSKNYDKRFAVFAKQVDDYNWMIRMNANDGVIQDIEQQRLKTLKQEIIHSKRQLLTIEDELSKEASKIADFSDRLNNAAERINRLIFLYNNLFSSWHTFYQGVYIDDLHKQTIDIYEFATLDKLRLVLAHEVGHALGLKHGDDFASIMYFRMEYQEEKNLKLSAEDVQAVRALCDSARAG